MIHCLCEAASRLQKPKTTIIGRLFLPLLIGFGFNSNLLGQAINLPIKGRLCLAPANPLLLIFGSMNDEFFMQQALRQAQLAFEQDEVPVGAVVVLNDKIIARGYNQVEKLNDPTAHAEIIALTSAFNYLGSKYLPDATLYVTVEPCVMCAGALYWSKIGRIVYGASDEKNGYRRVAPQVSPFHPKTEVVYGVLREECAELMKRFFRNRR